MKFIRKLFCKHSYEQVSWYVAEDKYRNERYSIRIYKCAKCGKQIEVDGRCDPYFKAGK